MRSPEDREIALECLKLVVANIGALADHTDLTESNVIGAAERFYAFVTGAPDADAKLAEVRKLVA